MSTYLTEQQWRCIHLNKVVYDFKTKEKVILPLTEDELNVEYKEDEEIVVEPTLEERLEQTEQLLQATTMAFTEFVFNQTMGKQHDDN